MCTVRASSAIIPCFGQRHCTYEESQEYPEEMCQAAAAMVARCLAKRGCGDGGASGGRLRAVFHKQLAEAFQLWLTLSVYLNINHLLDSWLAQLHLEIQAVLQANGIITHAYMRGPRQIPSLVRLISFQAIEFHINYYICQADADMH